MGVTDLLGWTLFAMQLDGKAACYGEAFKAI